MRIGDLHYKEVINISTGQRLGYVSDIEFNIKTGKVLSFIVPGPRRMWGLLPAEADFIFPWDSIIRMGEDTSLISLDSSDQQFRRNINKKHENSLY